MTLNRRKTIKNNLAQIKSYIDKKFLNIVVMKIKDKLTDIKDPLMINEVFRTILIDSYIFLKVADNAATIIKTINDGYPNGEKLRLNKQFLDTLEINTLFVINNDDLAAFMTTEHYSFNSIDLETALKDSANNNVKYNVCTRLGVIKDDEENLIRNRDKNIIPTLQGSQKRKSMPEAITDVAPNKMRKMLKDTMVHIFDSYVHMTIAKDEAHIWRFFDSFEDQEALDTFYTNMTKYLKACRIRRIQYHYGDGDTIQTTNIDDYIAEFLDTNDVNELIMKLGSIKEEKLGDIKMETKLLIRSARQRVAASIN